MTHEGQETGSAGDTELGQLSVSSYNGSLGGQQTLLRPEGGKGREKKIHPAAGMRMKLHVLGDPVLCSTLPGKAQ